ncbi:MAG TPA: serine--tRNA ligase, partial [archaeon]|nr:serine--tRNA ligase [archaeon]
MIDPKVIRENYSEVKTNLSKRQQPEIIKKLDKWVENDKEWRKLKQEVDELRQERNKITEEIKIAKANKKDITKLLDKAKKIPQELKEKEEKTKKLEEENKSTLMTIPNLLDESVPYGKGEEGNKEIRQWGKISKKDFEIKHHGQLAETLKVADFKNSVKIAGEGFY